MVPVASRLVDTDPFPDDASLTPDDPLAGLAAWVAEGRVDAAAAERARHRWLQRQAGEDATLAGVLMDLAERGRPVAVRSAGGLTARGRIVALGADFVIVREDRVGDVVVPFAAVATVRPTPGEPAPVGARPLALALTLAEALVELAAERPDVAVAAGDELRGELRRAGRDTLTVALDDSHRTVVTVHLPAVDRLVIVRR